MKKFVMAIVCLMTMVLCVNAQNEWKDPKYRKIKEAALNEFKSNLIAPTQFILSTSDGKRITVDELWFSEQEEEIKLDTVYYRNGNDYNRHINRADSIVIYEKVYPHHWDVLVHGDAMNRAGGYKHTSGIICVYGTEEYPYARDFFNRKCITRRKCSIGVISSEKTEKKSKTKKNKHADDLYF